jgi:hypothetical protein
MTGAPERCPYCSARLRVVHVHGHGQCAVCGTSIDPCCTGAGPGEASAAPPLHRDLAADPQLFARVFAALGGSEATVTAEALAFALVQRQAVGLDDANLLIEAGLHTGKLRVAVAGAYRLGR